MKGLRSMANLFKKMHEEKLINWGFEKVEGEVEENVYMLEVDDYVYIKYNVSKSCGAMFIDGGIDIIYNFSQIEDIMDCIHV